jgi:hypothetical protein
MEYYHIFCLVAMKNTQAKAGSALLVLNRMLTDDVLPNQNSLKTPREQLYDSCHNLIYNSTRIYGPLLMPYFCMF